MTSKDDDFRRQADHLRRLPLDRVLTAWGARRDPGDRSRWHTERGAISVTGSQFFNWHAQHGSGGAIDLVMHLSGHSAGQAIQWLAHEFAAGLPERATRVGTTSDSRTPRRELRLPARSLAQLARVHRYLTQQRGLSAALLAPLIDAGRLYADARGNAVFLMVQGKRQTAIGAELRGTAPQAWRGLAPGSRRDAGYFWIGNPNSKTIVVCESAIDAISCCQFHACRPQFYDKAQRDDLSCAERICISTAGARSFAPWLEPLVDRGYTLYCGFDTDEPGEAAAARMMQHYTQIQRLRPPAHDWNDALLRYA